MSKTIETSIDNALTRASGRSLGSVMLIIMWMYGIVLSKGFWGMFFAIFTPYSLYLAVESIAKFIGLAV